MYMYTVVIATNAFTLLNICMTLISMVTIPKVK